MAAEAEVAGVSEGAAAAGVGGLAEGGGARLSGFLAEAAELRGVGPAFTIDEAGVVYRAGAVWGEIEGDGEIFMNNSSFGRRVVGRIAEGQILEYAGGRTLPIGQLRAFIPGEGARLLASPDPIAEAIQALPGEVTGDVLEIRNGWFEIQLQNGLRGWVWGPTTAVEATFLMAAGHRSSPRQSGAASRRIALSTGRSLVGTIQSAGEATRVQLQDGRTVVLDSSLLLPVEGEGRGVDFDCTSGTARVALSNDETLFVSSWTRQNDTYVFAFPRGLRMYSDASLVREIEEPRYSLPPAPASEAWRKRGWNPIGTSPGLRVPSRNQALTRPPERPQAGPVERPWGGGILRRGNSGGAPHIRTMDYYLTRPPSSRIPAPHWQAPPVRPPYRPPTLPTYRAPYSAPPRPARPARPY